MSGHVSPTAAPLYAGPAVRIRDLAVRRDGQLVLGAVDLEVMPGEFVMVVGESGAGKSTLLEALVRTVAVEPDSELTVLGHDLTRLKPEVGRPDPPELARLRRRLRIAFQDPETVFDAELPTGAVLERFGARSCEDLRLCRRLRRHLEQRRSVPIRHLSGWDKRALSLWAALDRDIEVLLADEPLAGADPGHLQLILDGFAELAARGAAVLIVTHLIVPVAAAADRVAVLHRGRLAETLPGPELLTHARHPYTQLLVAAARAAAVAEPLRPAALASLEPPPGPPPPFQPLMACQAGLRSERFPILCAADPAGQVHVLEDGRWRLVLGDEAEQLACVLAVRGLDVDTLLER
jgi:peptide/nickel transport system ATP-binding protein